MAVTVKIPTQLRSAAGGETELTVDGTTLGEVLDAVYERHGELRDRLSGDDGALRRFVNVYVDGEDARLSGGIDAPVPAGAEVLVLPSVAGG